MFLLSAAKAAGRVISHNPVIAGGTTAFAVSMLFFGSNALLYQPFAQKHAFFQTRPNPYVAAADTGPSMTGSIENGNRNDAIPKPPSSAAAAPLPSGGDPAVAKVQKILARLKLYSGDIDGLPGPQTHSAVQAYQQIVGLEPSGEISDSLLRQLDAQSAATGSIPVPSPAPRDAHAGADATLNATHASNGLAGAQDNPADDTIVVKVQAGLRAFGNDRIELDGVLGGQTQAAIREFQSLFGLPVTGQIDDRLIAKMQEVGLIGS